MDEWSRLSNDVLTSILKHVDRHELQFVRLVNQWWKDAADSIIVAVRVSSKAVQLTGSVMKVANMVTRCFVHLESLDLVGIPDHNVDLFMSMTNLTELDLKGRQITDSGLKPVTALKKLRVLNLWDTSIGNRGMGYVNELQNLQSLHLSWARVEDNGVKALSGLLGLVTLNLWATGITDIGLKYLGKMKTLTSLDLTDTKITDAGAEQLAGLSNLTSLDFSFTAIGDKSIQSVRSLEKLSHLGLRGTEITYQCLESIAVIGNLKYLNVQSTLLGNDYAICPEHFAGYFSNLEFLTEIVY